MKRFRHPALVALLFAAATVNLAPTRAAETTPPVAPEGGQPGTGNAPSLDVLFNLLDTNRDGKISKDEATGRYAQRFSQWDANGDGFATREEIHNYRLGIGIDDNGQRIPGSPPAAAGNAGNAGGQRRAGTAATATILKEPADWRLETMSVPPGFAPDIKLTGSEEIRFAPGMFDTAADTYFTCVIAIAADGAPKLGLADIKDFLEKYYRGLSLGVGRRKGLSPDPAEMRAVVASAPSGPDIKNRFVAQVVFFDSFSDGRKITLNVEAQTIPLTAKKQTCLLLLVSPSSKESAAWKTLREIEKKTATNLVEAK